ncbi:DUF6516 family protein [Natrarchaeobius sp. A-rgal3]|uniref:toxin-antitoxin system TumE family protein n=1 Tax=Natrarchaeobius versutus TaxID=1679078 RepID=UPI003510A518
MGEVETLYQQDFVGTLLREVIVIYATSDVETYPSSIKYRMHLGTVDGLDLLRYDNSHSKTIGHEKHVATGDTEPVDFPGIEALLVEFWCEADQYWRADDVEPPRPY